MKLDEKHTGLQAGDILKVWETGYYLNSKVPNLMFEATRNGKKLEFDGEGRYTRTDITGSYELDFISLLADLTGLRFNQIEGETVKAYTLYLLA